MQDLRSLLDLHAPYIELCREERNYTALLYYALLLPGNTQRFVDHLRDLDAVPEGWPSNSDATELYVEYALPRDLWNKAQPDFETALHTLFTLCQVPLNVEARNPLEFNSALVSGVPSAKRIQNPGRWSIAKIDQRVDRAHNTDFIRLCMFKWSFNIKPDLVLTQPDPALYTPGHAIVIEAKYDSGEGMYPVNAKERDIFAARRLPLVGQCEVQRFLFEEILGVKAKHLLIRRHLKPTKEPTDPQPQGATITWDEAFRVLDLSRVNAFTRAFLASQFQIPEDPAAPLRAET